MKSYSGNYLQEDDQTLIESILRDIARNILTTRSSPRLGLFDGLSGEILAAYCLQTFYPELIPQERLEAAIEHVQENSAALKNNLSFGSGLAGTGWLFEFLLSNEGTEGWSHFNDNTDKILQRATDSTDWKGDIELVIGLSGLTAYASRRLRAQRGGVLINNIIRILSDKAEWDGDKCCWATPSYSLFLSSSNADIPEYNLGLAHGVPSIVASILPIIDILDDHTLGRSLVRGGCNWLISAQQNQQAHSTYYGYHTNTFEPSRLGWCYGDLAIALTLARAGNSLNEPRFKEEAKNIALHAASRSPESAMVNDAGLCHGSSGLFLMFDLINRQGSHEYLRIARDFWLRNTLDRYRADGLEGLRAISFDPKSKEIVRNPSTTFLSGYSGIALALARNIGEPPIWGDALLLS